MLIKKEADIFLKLLLIGLLCSFSWIIAACTPQRLPADAEEALNQYWQSLPPAPDIEYHINRSWSGVPPKTTTSSDSKLEVWCVETTSSDQVGPGIPDPLVWILVRQNPSDEWSVSLLMAMSSTWPYEACQIDIFGDQ